MGTGTAHKVISACLRVLEFCCSGIILGLLSRFFYLIDQLDGPNDSRLIFALSMAAISVFFAMVLVPPVKYSFYCFPIDFSIFVCWITCYALLQDLSGTSACSSSWFTSYWTVYWNGSSVGSVITSPGCSQWRVVLGFSFIVAFVWLTSACLGLYACLVYHNLGKHTVSGARRLKFWKKPKNGDVENGNVPERPDDNLLPKVG
jgi:hypothetical protein